jgi:hypothetical protein
MSMRASFSNAKPAGRAGPTTDRWAEAQGDTPQLRPARAGWRCPAGLALMSDQPLATPAGRRAWTWRDHA